VSSENTEPTRVNGPRLLHFTKKPEPVQEFASPFEEALEVAHEMRDGIKGMAILIQTNDDRFIAIPALHPAVDLMTFMEIMKQQMIAAAAKLLFTPDISQSPDDPATA
jgi:hypothetical protein